MAYGLKYTISQLLRNGALLKVEILERDYTGIVKTYDAVNINLESNSSGDEPLPSIISSQLNVSFVISDADAASTFPDLLSFDDRKYFVKLYSGATFLWCGFLFNDYVSLPFSTGFVQVDIVAIDGLSLLEYSQFNFVDNTSVNSLIRLIDVIAECINLIDYPDPISIITSCSYYAEGMFDRSDASGDEPLSQSYIYRRDIQGKTYYEVLDNIVTSFGCRLFQSDGQWQFLAINEMAQTTARYYTQYFLYPTVSIGASGTLDEAVNIAPYAEGNVHFINNSQDKVVRKGFPKLIHNYTFEYPSNYIHNGTFKGLYNSGSVTNLPYGWFYFQSTTSPYAGNVVTVIPDSEYNELDLSAVGNRDQFAYLQNTPNPPFQPNYYTPYMTGPSFTFSFEYQMVSNFGKVEIACIVGATTYYYNETNNTWGTTQHYVTYVEAPAPFLGIPWASFSLNVSMSYPAIPFAFGGVWAGYIRIKFFVRNATIGDYSDTRLRNIRITQNPYDTKSIEVTRQVGTGNTNVKTTSQPYGSFVYLRLATSFINTTNLGVLYNVSGVALKNWYRWPRTETFLLLQMLIARQFSNLLNRNYGTLEAELGSFKTAKGLNYLDKVYTLTDSTSNALSYNGKKFLMNRGAIIPRVDEVASFQIIEVTDQDNTSTETVKYIEE